MKRVQAVTGISIGMVFGLIILAEVVRPLLPWLFAVFILACIFRILLRDS